MNNKNESQSGPIAYFGYGSLVNRLTHDAPAIEAIPARLNGYARKWRPRPDMPGFPAALLTVFENVGSYVDGLLVVDHAHALPAIDAREARYFRKPLTVTNFEIGDGKSFDGKIYVYQAIEHLPPHRDPPLILRSYLDTVMQGFAAEHGLEGLRRFLKETGAFDIGVHDDRNDPVYPRAVSISSDEAFLFDQLLEEYGVVTVNSQTKPKYIGASAP